MSPAIKNIIVIGGSGSIGRPIIDALLAASFNVSVVTRESSTATFPPRVTVHRSDYSERSLLPAFKNKDAVVSTIATYSVQEQISLIDIAIKAGIKRFIPSEYGIDTSLPHISEFVPPAVHKHDVVKYLKTKESSGLSWTAICVGGFFDWVFQYPGLMGWNLPERKVTIFDGGDIEYEVTNVDQIGRAVANSLLPQYIEQTTNVYVYINSFTVSQNRVLSELERLTGNKFEVTNITLEDLSRAGMEKLKSKDAFESQGGGQYAPGSVEVITALIHGYGGFNNFSKTQGLWNKRLGLPVEDLKETLERVIQASSSRNE